MRSSEGGQFNGRRVDQFAKVVNDCELFDGRFDGPKFMWTNVRFAIGLVEESLVRVLANYGWREAFP